MEKRLLFDQGLDPFKLLELVNVQLHQQAFHFMHHIDYLVFFHSLNFTYKNLHHLNVILQVFISSFYHILLILFCPILPFILLLMSVLHQFILLPLPLFELIIIHEHWFIRSLLIKYLILNSIKHHHQCIALIFQSKLIFIHSKYGSSFVSNVVLIEPYISE